MKIFLVGGGTGGATAPVLAVAEALKKLKPASKFYLIGSNGIERQMLKDLKAPVEYLSIPAGKWRRYFSLRNFFDIFKTAFGFLKTLFLIGKYRPDVVFGAGSYVQVPVAWAAFVRGVPVVAHQQDWDLLLSTRLVAPIASAVTVSFTYSGRELPQSSGLLKKVPKSKITVTGNPFRAEILGGSKANAIKTFNLNENFPTVLIMGGSTGSAKINEVTMAALPQLVNYVQIIHITGGRASDFFSHPNYHQYEFLQGGLADAYAAADLVVCRAGMSTITELSALGKAALVIPLPNSPQEDNARLLAATQSAVGVFEESFNPDLLVKLVRKILWSKELQETLKKHIRIIFPKDADDKIAKLLIKIHERS